ncbi:bifunctional heptose 7-phosphate kinase/heptose 1-phosphate adenyltransferase [Paenibacillus sp. PAMC21692]|uniref:bifunctional heptose 7-phosphate kinase/heptose 1-phosphate adenyltransferase n=1 Tax=Paenibacillus sp. PAMC21692 TaxID=2762320 RepID=UPI00164ED1E3|nr:PfkB family carbohydrate kinase [Paenibacillus sp. PAMC21692]QNK54438.1 sugar kinase [Paenibacillus sp. PAMC21692]
MENKHLIASGHLHVYEGMSKERVEEVVERIGNLRAAVIGDGCLDVYWDADMSLSTLSRETPHYSLPIIGERVSPGAGGNVAMNLRALGCREVSFCTATADDWRGNLLHRCLEDNGINDSYSLSLKQWVTPAYCKPIRHGLQGVSQEDPRLDFINRRALSADEEKKMIAALDEMMQTADIVAVTDQLPLGIITEAVRVRLQFWSARGKQIVVDSRDRIGKFNGVCIKPNEIESLQALGLDPREGEISWERLLDAGKQLQNNNEAPCCMTIGSRGALWFDGGTPVWVPGHPVKPPLDIVGAGDHFASAFLCARGAGCSGPESMFFAQLGAAVVIRKLGMTGTADRQEILARYDEIMNGKTENKHQ